MLTILLCALLLLILLYLFLIMPRIVRRPDCSALHGVYYAHRGLHDNATNAPENSIAAIEKAVQAGFGIEFDVQLTRDRIPVVFHDETLERVCGVPGHVRDYTYAELCEFPLLQSDQHIPTFREVLDAVDSRVPLIIEIKIHERASEVCEKTDEILRGYKGVYCIESFHPMAGKWYRENRPEVIRGQLSSNFNKPGKPEPFDQKLVHHLLTNVLCRPDFIAYGHEHKGNLSRRLCTALFGALPVAWTIKSQQELDAARKDFKLFIFEGFIPKD